jgi:hypothetical protein
VLAVPFWRSGDARSTPAAARSAADGIPRTRIDDETVAAVTAPAPRPEG